MWLLFDMTPGNYINGFPHSHRESRSLDCTAKSEALGEDAARCRIQDRSASEAGSPLLCALADRPATRVNGGGVVAPVGGTWRGAPYAREAS